MIVKMKFLSITGPQNDIDRVVDQYLSKYEIHLENALSKLNTVENLRPYMELNPYRELLNKADSFCQQLSITSCSSSDVCSKEHAMEVDVYKRQHWQESMRYPVFPRSSVPAVRPPLSPL